MIDKITPRPNPDIASDLEALGVEEMQPVETAKRTYIAPFINGEAPQYLVIEDSFPNGRPALEKGKGVYLGSRDTVNKSERMKVTALLNPVHSALAPIGVLLGEKYFAHMLNHDPKLRKLGEIVAYAEGLPVCPSPGILDPKAFADDLFRPRTFLPENKRVTPQLFLADTCRDIAAGSADRHNLILQERDIMDIGLRGVALDERKVQFPIPDLLLHLPGVPADEVDFDAGHCLDKAGKGGRQYILCERCACADVQRALETLAQAVHPERDFPFLSQQFFSLLVEVAGGFRQLHLPFGAVEKGDAQFFLQFPDTLGHGGLREVQFVCSPCHVEMAGKGAEYFILMVEHSFSCLWFLQNNKNISVRASFSPCLRVSSCFHPMSPSFHPPFTLISPIFRYHITTISPPFQVLQYFILRFFLHLSY